MLTWASGGAPIEDPIRIYDGTLSSLTTVYLKHKASPYFKLRPWTRETYGRRMGYIARDFPKKYVPELTIVDFGEMHSLWIAPIDEGEPRRVSHAHEQMVFLKLALRFGKALKLKGCRDAEEILADMAFPNVRPRKTIVDNEQAIAIRAEAHRQGLPSIALTQAFQTSLGVRQRDVIGEWVPVDEPGLSDVHARGRKWITGFRWEEIDEHLKLTHRLSKSLRGRDAVADPDEGKVKTWDLALYPMVIEELARTVGAEPGQLRRAMLPASGPVIISERTQAPWAHKRFGANWRKIASKAGIPDAVQNRDSRAGAASDARRKGADKEQIRQGLGHSRSETTEIYLRAEDQETAEVAVLRFGKNTTRTP